MSGKKSFYCWYLGFTEAFGLQGQNRVYEVIQNILKYHQNDSKNYQNNPGKIVSSSKVTLTLSDNHLTIVDNTVPSQRKLFKKSSQSASKAYSISYDKITYVFRLTNLPYSDIVTFITKSLPNESNYHSNLSMFLHAFRCDSDDTAVKLERYLTQFLRVYNKKLEKLENRAKKNALSDRNDFFNETGHLHNSNLKNSFLNRQALHVKNRTVYDSSSGGGTRSSSSNDLLDTTNESGHHAINMVSYNSRPTSPLQLDFKNIKKELEYKLKSDEPILYPPKDYDEEDRQRGNLKEIQSRRSQNPSIIGKEAYKKLNASNNSLNDLDEMILTNRSDFTSASFNEQANQVLKMLDDVVNSEIANRPDYDVNERFEFKPPRSEEIHYKKSFRSAGYGNLAKYSNMSASMESIYQKNKPSNFRNLSQKSSSIDSGLHDPYLSGNVKTNPLMIIEEEPQFSSQFQHSMFKASNLTGNSLENQTDSLDLSANKAFGQGKFSKNSKYSSKKSNQNSDSYDSSGFRPGVFAKLSSYQPQWLSSSVQNDSFYAKNEKAKKNKNLKLKYSESAKVNRPTEPAELNFRPALSSKNKFNAKKNLPRVKENKFEHTENSQFILKSHDFLNVNERYERENQSNYRIRNNSSYYKSESSLANNNRYVFNDIYY